MPLELLLKRTTSIEEAVLLIRVAFRKRIGKILVMEEKDVDVSKPLHAHGVDSLVAMELRQWCMKELGADLSVLEILGDSNIARLAEKAAQRSGLVSKALAKSEKVAEEVHAGFPIKVGREFTGFEGVS